MMRVSFWHWPVELGDDFADRFGSTSRGGDDVLTGAAAVPPQFAGGTVHGLLGGSDGMDCALKDKDTEEEEEGSMWPPLSNLVMSCWCVYNLCWILTIKPSTMPKLSLMTLARGARQLVVQEALLGRQK